MGLFTLEYASEKTNRATRFNKGFVLRKVYDWHSCKLIPVSDTLDTACRNPPLTRVKVQVWQERVLRNVFTNYVSCTFSRQPCKRCVSQISLCFIDAVSYGMAESSTEESPKHECQSLMVFVVIYMSLIPHRKKLHGVYSLDWECTSSDFLDCLSREMVNQQRQ